MKVKKAKFIKGILGSNAIMENGIFQVAFFGRSNVGKSSSINALLNRKSLVKSSSKPGKTREINFFETEFFLNKKEEEEKIAKVYFVDLPGYGYARLSPEKRESLRKMIIWYLTETALNKRLNIIVLDAKVGLTEFDSEVMKIIKETGQKGLLLLNKSDKLNQKNKRKALKKLEEESLFDVIEFSAFKKRGIEKVLNKIEVEYKNTGTVL